MPGTSCTKELGPGLLESVHEAILARNLAQRGWRVERQKSVPIHFDGMALDEGFQGRPAD